MTASDKTSERHQPEHPDGGRQVAVAVRDRTTAGERPRVTAKGHGKLAEQILAIAFEQGVKVRSDADLAEILAAVDVDSEIPLEALAAVSEILTYVYQATRDGADDGGPEESPSLEAPARPSAQSSAPQPESDSWPGS